MPARVKLVTPEDWKIIVDLMEKDWYALHGFWSHSEARKRNPVRVLVCNGIPTGPEGEALLGR